jgi:hypothetical protein
MKYSKFQRTCVHTEIGMVADLFIKYRNVNTLCHLLEWPRATKDTLAGPELNISGLQPWTYFSSSETRTSLNETCTSPKKHACYIVQNINVKTIDFLSTNIVTASFFNMYHRGYCSCYSICHHVNWLMDIWKVTFQWMVYNASNK